MGIIASIISFAWIGQHVKEIAIGLAVIIFLIILTKHNMKKQAIRAQQARIERERAEADRRAAAEAAREAEEQRQREAAAAEKENRIQRAIEANPGSERFRSLSVSNEVTVHNMTITEFTPISKVRYVAFDLETTGISHVDHSIVEIGAVRVENGHITDTFSQLIDPERPMPADATAVNHITDSMLRGQPKIYEVLPAFLNFVGDDVLVAHNAPFDVRFISQACMRNGFIVPGNCFDTMNFARYWPEAENRKLTTLAAAAGIPCGTAHRALDDAKTVAQLVTATNEKRKK